MAQEEGKNFPELTRPGGTFYFVLVTKAGSPWQDEYGRSYVFSHKASGSPAKLTQAVKSGRVEYVLYKPGPDFAFSGSGVVRALEEDPTDTTDSEKRLLLDHSEFSTPLELKGNAASLLDELDFLRDRGLSTFNRNSIVPISRNDFDTIRRYAAEGSGAMVDKFEFPGFDDSDFDAFQPHKAESNDYKEERIAVREKLWKLRSDLDKYLAERGIELVGSTNRVSIGGPISSVQGLWLAYTPERARYYQQLQLNTAISIDGVQVRLNCEPRNADSQAVKRFLELRSQALLDKLKGLDGYRFLIDEKWGDRTKVDKPADRVTLADLGEYEPTTDYFSLGRSFARDSDIVRSPEFAGVARSILFDDLHPVYRMILGPDVDESGIYLMPASGGQAAVHRQATLENPVPLSTIEPHLDIDEVREIEEIFGDEPIRAWRSLPTSGETPSTWAKLKPDDVVLVYFDGRYPYVARVAIKFQNKALAGDLWTPSDDEDYEYMFLLRDFRECQLSREEFNQILGYADNYAPQGFGPISEERRESIVNTYGTVENFVDEISGRRAPVWLQGPDHEAWLRSAVERFQEWEAANPSVVERRVATHEEFAKAFSPDDLSRLSVADFRDLLHEFLHHHGRVGITGSWRVTLEEDAEHVQRVLVHLLKEVSTGRPLAEAMDEALAEFDFNAILFVGCVLHDFDWDRYAIFFIPTQQRRMKRIGMWPATDRRSSGSRGERYELACDIQGDFLPLSGLNLDRTDHFLFWAEQIADLRYPPPPPPPLPVDPLARIHSHIKSCGFVYPREQVTNYYIALRTKPFVILTGLSGTGKTALTRLLSEALGPLARYELVPVKPNWNDSRDLLGFYNPILERYHTTQFLKFLLEAAWEYDENREDAVEFYVCLDEMNLARVEYYFAELLSAMESDDKRLTLHREPERQPGLRTTIMVRGEQKQISVPQEVEMPPNFYLSGTVNIDETVYPFSDKVKDRANTIELTMDFEAYRNLLLTGEVPDDAFKETVYEYARTDHGQRVLDVLGNIHEELATQRLHFGYRIVDEVLAYMARNEELDSESRLSHEQALDNQIMQKILPKVRGRGEFIKDMLWCAGQECGECLHCICTNAGANRSAEKIERMWKHADREGATSFDAAR